ncbi:TOBE domain-containing protein [Oligella urethralis]|uniref:Transcriptional regulator modE n=1 Tax=Oligella urethralis TaxID=90245 RepID=A0A2X1WED3_9BURK|nr:TOBE domain-containing protein [Oligella urethralis]SPY07004.1 Transcriptional regulator modE [Oligella urethralis]SUA60030.1 Transcriptional regulator modE [Oligella urethralis]
MSQSNQNHDDAIRFQGRFWIERHAGTFLGPGRIELLEQIESGRSIAEAARQLGMGYKTAWDMLNAINNLADEPVVISIKGGRRGGGSRITDYGKKLIAFYRHIESEYQAMLISLEQRYANINDFAVEPSPRLQLRTSARNQLSCSIQALEKRGHRIMVRLNLGAAQEIQAMITQKSIDEMKLSVGQQVFALIKAPMISLSQDSTEALEGVLEAVDRDEAGGAELLIHLKSGQTIAAMIDDASQAPECGATVYAAFDPKQVIIATS